MRLDQFMKKQGIVPSRQKAKDYILHGKVTVDGETVTKPSFDYKGGDVQLLVEHQYVSRGAYKLIAGLEASKFNIQGKICMDIGASTGGFTEVLLENGAEKIYAIDVGKNQLAPRIKQNAKVISYENTDIRNLKVENLNEKINFFTIDVSFISLEEIIPSVRKFLECESQFIILIKPQFELGKGKTNKNGIIKDEKDQRAAVKKIVGLLKDSGFQILGCLPSPISGKDGNKEFLVYGQLSKN